MSRWITAAWGTLLVAMTCGATVVTTLSASGFIAGHPGHRSHIPIPVSAAAPMTVPDLAPAAFPLEAAAPPEPPAPVSSDDRIVPPMSVSTGRIVPAVAVEPAPAAGGQAHPSPPARVDPPSTDPSPGVPTASEPPPEGDPPPTGSSDPTPPPSQPTEPAAPPPSSSPGSPVGSVVDCLGRRAPVRCTIQVVLMVPKPGCRTLGDVPDPGWPRLAPMRHT